MIMDSKDFEIYQIRLREVEGIIAAATKDGLYRGIEYPVTDHANRVYFKVLKYQGDLTPDAIERLVCEADGEMGNAGLSAGQVDRFVSVALLLLDRDRFLDHFLARWRLSREAIPMIDRFVSREFDLKNLPDMVREFRI